MSPEEKAETLKKIMKEAEPDPYTVSNYNLKLGMAIINEMNTHSAGPSKASPSAGAGRGRKKKEVEIDESKLLDLDSFIKEP